MIDKKGPIRGKNINILSRAAERTGAVLKIFLNGRTLKKYQVLADSAFYSDGFQDDSQAGSQKGLNTLIGYKFLAAFLAAFFPVFFMRNIIFMVLVGAVSAAAGFFMPDLILKYISKRRIKEFNKDLPHIIDLLHIATLSGQNIYNSIKIVSEKYNGSICMALKKFLKEIDFGVSRIDSFKNTVNVTDPGNFRNFLFLLIQAEKYGSSISDLLSLQSRYIRFEVTQKHEAASRRSSIILLFPLVFLILPAFILLVGGPLIYSIAGSFLNFT